MFRLPCHPCVNMPASLTDISGFKSTTEVFIWHVRFQTFLKLDLNKGKQVFIFLAKISSRQFSTMVYLFFSVFEVTSFCTFLYHDQEIRLLCNPYGNMTPSLTNIDGFTFTTRISMNPVRFQIFIESGLMRRQANFFSFVKKFPVACFSPMLNSFFSVFEAFSFPNMSVSRVSFALSSPW